MNEETLKQLEVLKNHPNYNRSFFYDSLEIIVIYILPNLTQEQKKLFNFDSIFEYMNDDGYGINHYGLIKELNFIGVDSSLVAELSESILRESEFYMECTIDKAAFDITISR